MNINEQVAELRKLMKQNNIDTYVITKFDPHQSEDSEDYYSSVNFISGFTGSAGFVVITANEANVWADGRYYIQCANEIADTCFIMHKASEPNVKNYLQYSYDVTPTGGVIGFAGDTISYSELKVLLTLIGNKNITIKSDVDLIGEVWNNRPTLSDKKAFEHDVKFAGKSRLSKINEVKEVMKKEYCSCYILSSLDDIAWLLNLRGTDVANNTFFSSYVIIHEDRVVLFANLSKLENVKKALISDGIEMLEYSEIFSFIKQIPDKTNTIITPKKTNYALYNSGSNLNFVMRSTNITEDMKAIKNSTELNNLEKVNVRDGVYMVKAIKWIKENASHITEIDVANKLKELRSADENFISTSFTTIPAYMANAAMMHYHATKDKCSKLSSEGFLLIDSGGQYYDGTTDITRTISLGHISEEMKEDFTLVLQSHIAIAKAKFLNGATGSKIDMLGRVPMWNVGKNYNCGTGHGLGFCGCVHEGPHGMSMRPNLIPLKEGMLITNEPGIYKNNKYGIRTENTVVVIPFMETEDGKFFQFRTISYCPIDVDSIKIELLSKEELSWINNYHKIVYDKLAPFMNDEEREFLKKETQVL